MLISIETPVFKGLRLQRCIDSVLAQSSPDWTLSLLWDGGDQESKQILEELDRRRLPNVTVHFAENRGIARARRFLSEHSRGDYILPLDDDDALPFHAVEHFLKAAALKPWASILRARREIIDEEGKVLDTPAWFPFEARHYQNGMVTDLYNHSQPYLIRRSAYERTSGWEGFADFSYAGEDCDIYLKLEEMGTIELLDEVLYYYRVHDKRASLVLTDEAAFEMWRRLSDKTIERIGLPLRRVNDKQPFEYERTPRPLPTLAAVDFVITGGAAGSDRVTETLHEAGVLADAIHATGDGCAELARGIEATTRPCVCVLHGGVELTGIAPLEGLIEGLGRHNVDLAAPKLVAADGGTAFAAPGFSEERLPMAGAYVEDPVGPGDPVGASWLPPAFLLMRREVWRAVGGLDQGYADTQLAVADLCLRARQRAFRCSYFPGIEVGVSAETRRSVPPADGERFLWKWTAYPALLGRAT